LRVGEHFFLVVIENFSGSLNSGTGLAITSYNSATSWCKRASFIVSSRLRT